jgi:hypothetical protein
MRNDVVLIAFPLALVKHVLNRWAHYVDADDAVELAVMFWFLVFA